MTSLVIDPRRGKVLASDAYDGPAGFEDTPFAVAAESAMDGFFVGGIAFDDFEDFLVLRYDTSLVF